VTKERSGKNGDHPQAWTVLAAKDPSSLAWFRWQHFQATHPFTEARMSVQGYDPVAIGLALFPSLSSQAKA